MNTPSPEYICWHENEFMADRAVVRMQPHQRLMYRALCQVARYCETRPYLPDDDNELYVLADADSLDHWKANREAVLVKFQKVTVDGKSILAHKRVSADAAKYEEWVAQKRGAGKASADSRRQRALDGRSTGAQQSSESTESCEKVKSNAVLQNGEPEPTTVGLNTTSQPQNDRTPEPTPLQSVKDIVEDIGGHPIALCNFFEKHILASNEGRKARGKKMADPRPANWRNTWEPDFQRLLDSGYTFSDLVKMITYSFGPRWVDFTFRPLNIVNNHGKLAADLKIPVHELVPTQSAAEKRADAARRRNEKEAEEWIDYLDHHLCSGGCGTGVEKEGRVCMNCQMKWRGAYKVWDTRFKEGDRRRTYEIFFVCDPDAGGCGKEVGRLTTPHQLCPICAQNRQAVGPAGFAAMTGGTRVQ